MLFWWKSYYIFRLICHVITILKIRKIWHAWDLYKLARSCKEWRSVCTSKWWNIPGTVLLAWISKLAWSFDIYWVRQLIEYNFISSKGPETYEMTIKLYIKLHLGTIHTFHNFDTLIVMLTITKTLLKYISKYIHVIHPGNY